jgi:ribonucleotide monophosphatase NagD (HAD superfamily)
MKIFSLSNPIRYGAFKSQEQDLKNGIITNITYFEEDTYAEQLYKQFRKSVKNYKFIKQEENKMKQTVIKYTEVGDCITIVSIENAASFAEIAHCYGDDTAKIYKKGYPFYLLTNMPGPTSIFLKDQFSSLNIYEGQVLTGKMFVDVIEVLKAAGKRLQSLVEEKKAEVKVIRI